MSTTRRELRSDKTYRRRSGLALHMLFRIVLYGHIAVTPVCLAIAQPQGVWVLIDTNALTLSVMDGDQTLRTFENIAIGSNGATRDKRRMDEKTPLGDFRISEIRNNSRFHIFLAIDYPTLEYAQRALKQGNITAAEYQQISEAWQAGEMPPQNTGLGGFLGIHGIGEGNIEVHSRFNWTNGCVALTNEQIDELVGMVGIGTRLSIR